MQSKLPWLIYATALTTILSVLNILFPAVGQKLVRKTGAPWDSMGHYMYTHGKIMDMLDYATIACWLALGAYFLWRRFKSE